MYDSIAINNGIDSANQADSDFTPFLNIINEWYTKDTSKKIRAVFKSKGQSGKPLCTNPPYGYIKDPEDRRLHWFIDEEALGWSRYFPTVYGWFGPTQMAKQRKAMHWYTYGSVFMKMVSPSSKTTWKPICLVKTIAVADILAKMEYLGHTVNFQDF